MQAAFLLLGQRYRRANFTCQLGAITQKEEQQIKHDGKTDQKIESALAKTERLGGKELTALQGPLGDFVAQSRQVAHAHTLQASLRECRENVLEAFDITGQIQFTAFQTRVQRRSFLHQQGADDDHRQNRDYQTHQQGQTCSEVAPPVQAQQQAPLQRREEDAKDHCPEHRAVER
ncbi:hypothetical protein D3C77_320440 [compost metagenome]